MTKTGPGRIFCGFWPKPWYILDRDHATRSHHRIPYAGRAEIALGACLNLIASPRSGLSLILLAFLALGFELRELLRGQD